MGSECMVQIWHFLPKSMQNDCKLNLEISLPYCLKVCGQYAYFNTFVQQGHIKCFKSDSKDIYFCYKRCLLHIKTVLISTLLIKDMLRVPQKY